VRRAGVIRVLCTVGVLAVLAAVPTHAGAAKRSHDCPRDLHRCPLALGPTHALIPGLNEDWQVRTGDLGYARALHARVIRFPLTWATVQPNGPSSWNWDVYDRLFADARARGLAVILVPDDAPCWAHPQLGCDMAGPPGPPDPEYDAQWAEFIRRAVARYPDVAGLEVWNEPNVSCGWAGAPSPTRYAALLQDAYRAAKSVRPDVPVLFGGLAQFNPSSPADRGYIDFLREAFAAGAAGYFDALALHPYPLPADRRDYRERMLTLIARARRVVRAGRHRPMPVWVTEIGLSTEGNGAVSEAMQAGRLDRLYRLLARVPNLRVVVVHRAIDRAGSGSPEDGYGLIRANGTPKPAYAIAQSDFARFYRSDPPGETPSVPAIQLPSPVQLPPSSSGLAGLLQQLTQAPLPLGLGG
jgi:hypothetical protein